MNAGRARGGLGLALALAMAPLVALGFSRFAYALLLPAMREDLGWTLSQAGSLNTANGAGYLAGALLAPLLGRRFGGAQAFGWSLGLSALALLVSAWPTRWELFLLIRTLGGVSTACAFVLGTELAARALPQRPATALALYFAGSGLGMWLAGLLLPALVLQDGQWRAAWALLGALALPAFAWAAWAARRTDPAPPVAAAAGRPRLWPLLWPSLVGNALYGAGYVGYTTFVMALLRDAGHGALASALFFSALGLASVLASPLWGRVLGRLRGGRGFALVSLGVSAGIVPVLLSAQPWALATSALLFGLCFMAGPAAVSVAAQRVLPAPQLALGLGALTAAFSLGQALGPLATGWLADRTGQLALALWLGPVLLVLGAGVSLRQR